MTESLAIAVGGAAGALFRYWLSGAVYALTGRGFPYGTLAVNVIGSLLMGMFYVLLVERVADAAPYRAFLMIGVLGAFTTFSTFSLETLQLVENGAVVKAGLNVAMTVALCLAGCWVGLVMGRQL